MHLAFKLTLFLTFSCRYINFVAARDDDNGEPTVVQSSRLPHRKQARAIKEAYKFSWNAYSKSAYGSDELFPVSKKGNNTRYGWGDTVIDGLTTAIVMELRDTVLQQLAFVNNIDFTSSKNANPIDLADVTSRYIGGMLSAYELLQRPYRDLIPRRNRTLVDGLLTKAKSFADSLKPAFDTTSGVPKNILTYTGNGTLTPTADPNTKSGYVGWLILDWVRLSDLTGDMSYAQLVEKAQTYLLSPSSGGEPMPGLIGNAIDVSTGVFKDRYGTWGENPWTEVKGKGYYEYLLKMYAYDPRRYASYKERWIKAAESTVMYLSATTLRTKPPLDLTFVGGFQGNFRDSVETHSTCYIGGAFLLGGRMFRRRDLSQYGEKLIESCHLTYAVNPTGIGYESFGWSDLGWWFDWDQYFSYMANGFYAWERSYNLGGDFFESLYYGYVFTGKEKYRNWAWEVFEGINRTCRVESGGFTAVGNSSAPDGGPKLDVQPTQWLSRSLKYLYMIFSEDSEGGLEEDGTQRWVFNSNAQPLRTSL